MGRSDLLWYLIREVKKRTLLEKNYQEEFQSTGTERIWI